MVGTFVMYAHSQGIDLAPGWQVRCRVCGKTKSAARVGIVRIGATSTSKRVLGYCSDCRRLRLLALEPRDGVADVDDPIAENDAVWQEVTAYVTEGTIDIDTAEQILLSHAPFERKREVAAQLAEGALTPDEAIRLLNV